MNSDGIDLDEAFPPGGPVGSNKPASVQAPVVEKVIVPNIYPTELARKVRKKDFTDGTVSRAVAKLTQEIIASRSGKRLHGLSATQIGLNIQIMIADVDKGLSGEFSLVTFVNPTLTTFSKQAVEWTVNCLTPDCGNSEPGPLYLSAIALDVEARVMRLVNKFPSQIGSPQVQLLPHSYYGVSAQRFYHQWRHLGHRALQMCVVSQQQATDELLRLTRRDNFKE